MSQERSRTLCRYYLHGACTRGASCPFSHQLADAESQVLPPLLQRCCRHLPPLPAAAVACSRRLFHTLGLAHKPFAGVSLPL